MKYFLGIDIGSTASSVVKIDENGRLKKWSYLFHTGLIIPTLEKQLAEIEFRDVAGMAYTSSCPDVFQRGEKIDSMVSYITTARHFHPGMEALLIVGGEKFGLVRFDDNGEYQNFKSNTSCASGTGSFLDQQLSRLQLKDISELSELASMSSGNFPKIASRCSVFAKTDLIHAQQEGYALPEICDGLCYGLAKNLVDAVFDEAVYRRIVVAGGVSLNAGVIKHIREITKAELQIDEYSHVYGAIGAALLACQQKPVLQNTYSDLADIISYTAKEKSFFNPPLDLVLSDYPDFSALEEYRYSSCKYKELSAVEVSVYEELDNDLHTEVYLGIDIGSTSTKAVLLDYEKRVIAGFYTRTSGRPLAAVQTVFEAIEDLEERRRHSFVMRGAGTTGSGRKLIGKIINADVTPDEITAHARAAIELDPETDTIIEIGGQDSKFTVMRDGIVTLSIMNNVCAAGTGSFIEEQANKLNCPLSDYSERASRSASPMTSDRCTVFMERDLNHYLHEGYENDELLASVLHSIRDNYMAKVAGKATIGNKIFFQGATAKNRALVAAFEQKLQKPIMVSKYCHLTGALGVALELHDKQPEKTLFRGTVLWKQNIPLRSEVCELCTNHCKLRVAELEDETVAYGFLCGRDYQSNKYVKNANHSFDLLKKHREVFGFKAGTIEARITVGIPDVLHLSDEIPLWQKFFDILGIKTLTSSAYKTAVKDGKKLADAEFCAPVSSAFGHVKYLKDKADFIFLPVYLEEGKNRHSSKMYCYYTQYISTMLASTKEFREMEILLMPMVRSLKSEGYAMAELAGMVRKIRGADLELKEIQQAFRTAMLYHSSIKEKWRSLFLEEQRMDDLNIVLLGRPYTVLSRMMNNSIPEIINKKGYNAFYMDMLADNLAVSTKNSHLIKSMTWKYASSILAAADHVANSGNLYPILITSFKCTPDSFAIEYFKDILDSYNKPYLILQLDEHDSAVGYETRIEAAINSFRNHYLMKKEEPFKEEVSELLPQNGISGKAREVLEDVREILKEHGLDPGKFRKQNEVDALAYELSSIKTGEIGKISGKTILIPGWDMFTARLLKATLEAEGWKAEAIVDTPESIQRSLNLNTGQCLPLNAITQNAYEFMVDQKLNPSEVTLWVPKGYLACNLTMFPHYMRKLLKRYDEGMSEVTVYPGSIVFQDFSIKIGVNAYLVYLFSGSIRKVACRIRPYEKIKGSTNAVVERSEDLLYDAFRNKKPKEPVIIEIIKMFDAIEQEKTIRPKVAIFGDMYARDNDVFNQELIELIEENGGEALPTSYSEYMRIILKQTELRFFQEGRYMDHYNLKLLKNLIPLLEGKYSKFFEKYIKNINPLNQELFDLLEKYHMHILHRGETVDNVLKIESLIRHFDDIALFVQTNPAYCCPSLVTEAMASSIEEYTGIPVVSIEYDGTRASKNAVIIPYLKFKVPTEQKAF